MFVIFERNEAVERHSVEEECPTENILCPILVLFCNQLSRFRIYCVCLLFGYFASLVAYDALSDTGDKRRVVDQTVFQCVVNKLF